MLVSAYRTYVGCVKRPEEVAVEILQVLCSPSSGTNRRYRVHLGETGGVELKGVVGGDRAEGLGDMTGDKSALSAVETSREPGAYLFGVVPGGTNLNEHREDCSEIRVNGNTKTQTQELLDLGKRCQCFCELLHRMGYQRAEESGTGDLGPGQDDVRVKEGEEEGDFLSALYFLVLSGYLCGSGKGDGCGEVVGEGGI